VIFPQAAIGEGLFGVIMVDCRAPKPTVIKFIWQAD
jgi:hypothetical protein